MNSVFSILGTFILVSLSTLPVAATKPVERDCSTGNYVGDLNPGGQTTDCSDNQVIDSQSTGEESWCYVVAQEQAAVLENTDNELTSPRDVPLDPLLAYNCLLSVPFIPEHGQQFIDYARQWLRFHSTLEWLADPPESYQQPAVDIMGRFDDLERRIDDGEFTSQYSFHIELAKLQREVGDTHFGFNLGLLTTFRWNIPYSLATTSSDGQELPQVYVWEDVMNSANEPSWEPSPISVIENQPAVDYLAQFALNHSLHRAGESHATWNLIMHNSAYSLDGRPSEFQSSAFYRGQSLSGSFQNGTNFEWRFIARTARNLLQEELTTGMALYNETVIRQPGDTSTTPSIQDAGVQSIDLPPNYPDDPIIDVQSVGGTVFGYTLEDTSIGVLVIPSFSVTDAQGFGGVVSNFISQARDAEMRQIVIDVTGNGGGLHFLGFDTFRRFFPEASVERFFRAPAIPEVDVIGSVLSAIIMDEEGIVPPILRDTVVDYYATAAEGLSAGLTLDENGDPFSSWEDYFGPVNTTTGTQVTNLAQFDFENMETNLSGAFDVVFNFANNTSDANVPNDTAHWRPEDIVILTDGNCGSTCVTMAGLMKDIMGVKIVTVGGLPTYGPSQSMVGSRGHLLEWDTINQGLYSYLFSSDETGSPEMLDPLFESLGRSRTEFLEILPDPLIDLHYRTSPGATLSSADAIRPDSEIPYTFHYEPSNCRLFYTMDMVRDSTVLWRTAARILDGDYDACVLGSTNQRGSDNRSMTEDPGFDTSFQAWESWSGSDTWGSRNIIPTNEPGDTPSTQNHTDAIDTTANNGADLKMPGGAVVMAFVLSVVASI